MATATISNKLADALLNHALRKRRWTPPNDVYLALHDADPTVLGDESTEIIGGSYARKIIRFYDADLRTTLNSNAVVFPNLPACTIRYLALWNHATAGFMMISVNIPNVSVDSGGTYRLEQADLAVIFGT